MALTTQSTTLVLVIVTLLPGWGVEEVGAGDTDGVTVMEEGREGKDADVVIGMEL
jgi:hypothetical protein